MRLRLNDPPAQLLKPESEPARELSFYCAMFMESKINKVKESTYVKYAAMLDKYIVPRFGASDPADISSDSIQEFAEELLQRESLSPKTVKDNLVLLSSILNFTGKKTSGWAVQLEIQYPKETKTEMRILTIDEQKSFTEFLKQDGNSCKLGILLALYTGIRIGELCALRWRDISLKEKTIKITHTMQRIKNIGGDGLQKTKIIIDTPKSDKSVRTIPITDPVALMCAEFYPGNPSAFVLTGGENYIEPRTLQYRFMRYTEKCGISDIHFHTLRHTFATRCIEVGFDVKSLSEILGHSSIKITLDRYVHPSLELKRSNMAKLSAIGF